MTPSKMPQKKRDALEIRKAHGQLALLAVGVSKYNKKSGFLPLSTCADDALALRDAFLDTWQLNADPSRINILTSNSDPFPSKGLIMHHAKELAENANQKDRILFYFSGHGHRLEGRFYLVPEDAYTDDDPDALIDFHKLTNILESSVAKQKIVILDACLSGPLVTKSKLISKQYSKKYLKEYLGKTKGIAILSSSALDEASYTQSPNPTLSLFTYYMVKAFHGDSKALDESGFLTINSLYDYLSAKVDRRAKSYHKKQTPCIEVKATGTIVFGDFTQAIISPSSFSPDEFPLSSLLIHETESFYVDYVLTNIKRWGAYSEDYLEQKVNENLGEYIEEDLGSKAATLRKQFGFSISEVGVEDCELTFPKGSLYYHYEAKGKKDGLLVATLSLQKTWLKMPVDISRLVAVLGITAKEIVFHLSKSINPSSLVSGLESKGWSVDSVLTHKIEASFDRFKIKAEESSLTFSGITVDELLGIQDISEKTELTYNTFALLGG